MSRPTNCLMFATPVRGIKLSEILGLFFQVCEIFSQQWNCVFSPLDVAVFLFLSCFKCRTLYFLHEQIYLFHIQKFGYSRFQVQCFSTALVGPAIDFFHIALTQRKAIFPPTHLSTPPYSTPIYPTHLCWSFCHQIFAGKYCCCKGEPYGIMVRVEAWGSRGPLLESHHCQLNLPPSAC